MFAWKLNSHRRSFLLVSVFKLNTFSDEQLWMINGTIENSVILKWTLNGLVNADGKQETSVLFNFTGNINQLWRFVSICIKNYLITQLQKLRGPEVTKILKIKKIKIPLHFQSQNVNFELSTPLIFHRKLLDKISN